MKGGVVLTEHNLSNKKIGELSALLATVQYRIGDNYKGREK